MKANELRIGNYVAMYKGDCFQLKLRDFADLEMNDGNISCSGIPLTEEWLLKFGFDRNILNANHNDIIYYSENNIAIKGMLGMVKPSQCIYVHQLQNLYFALTNEELIKE